MKTLSFRPDQIVHLQRELAVAKSTDLYQRMVKDRDEVLERYALVFSPENIGTLSESTFREFLRHENNKHWNSLVRQGPRICRDMDKLRLALGTLLDTEKPLPDRFAKAVKTASGMGKAIASAILLVAHPEKYGVWNNTSESAMRALGLFPKIPSRESIGTSYSRVNDVLVELTKALDIDLWILDALWWHMLQNRSVPADQSVAAELEIANASPKSADPQGFALEKHLHEFLYANWENISLGKEWLLYENERDDRPGYEFHTEIGNIDLLAKHKTQPQWLVIELKRAQAPDDTIGQVMRYMGWVQKHLASKGEEVRGLVISRDAHSALRYALAVTDKIDLLLYEVDFQLKRPEA